MEIKICGLRSIADIEIINRYAVHYAGFIFAQSPRRVTADEARGMRHALRRDIKAVGVFTHMPIEEVNKIAAEVNLDIIQLHSEESNEDCKKAICPVWKMIPSRGRKSADGIKEFPDAAGFLFDTYRKGVPGGTGETFSWNMVKGIPEKHFTILAGGLGPENVLQAYEAVKPQVLDINSGVETNMRKDENKIRDLMRRIRDGIE